MLNGKCIKAQVRCGTKSHAANLRQRQVLFGYLHQSGALTNVTGTTVNGTTNYVVDYASMGSTNLTFTITQSNPTTGAAVGTPIVLSGSSPLGNPTQIQLQTGVNVNVNVTGQSGAPVDNAFRIKINVNPN